MKKTITLILCILLFSTADMQSQIKFKKFKSKVLKKKSSNTKTGNAPLLATLNFSNKGRKWYISKNTGSGQLGTKERPAKDLGNIIHHG